MEYNLNNVFIQNENVETGDLGFTEVLIFLPFERI